MFHVGDIVDRRGRSVFPDYLRKEAGILKGLRSGKFRFDIYVSGKTPPVEIWSGQYLLVTPKVAKTYLKSFHAQIDQIPVQAVDRDSDRIHSMLLLHPLREVSAFVGTTDLDVAADPKLLKRTVDWTDEGVGLAYRLAPERLVSHDIVMISNAPMARLAISDRFRRALRPALPQKAGKFIEFREYDVAT